jgi:two-component sensor histidine kinase
MRISIWLFLININISIFYVCQFYDISTGAYLFYFPLVLAVALLHIPGESVYRTMNYYLLTILFFALSLSVDIEFIHSTINTPEDNAFLLANNIGFSVAISAIEIIMILNLINGQNKDLVKHLNTEKNLHSTAIKNIKEKEVLLSEVHHRVKNNLAIINGLLNLQKNKTTNAEAASILEDSRNRIISMSLVHEKLYKSNDFSGIELDTYLKELAEGIVRGTGNKFLQLQFEVEKVKVPVALAIPIGLIVNECIVNSIKHAFEGRMGVESNIILTIKKEDASLFIQCKDNGKGFPKSFDPTSDSSLGTFIIQSLSDQLEASFKYYNSDGACIDFNVPFSTSI